MAIINNNTYTSSQGFSKIGTYLTFGKKRIVITKKEDGNFRLNGICCVFYDHTSYLEKKKCMDDFPISTTITNTELSENLYGKLYETLKTTYTNTIDV